MTEYTLRIGWYLKGLLVYTYTAFIEKTDPLRWVILCYLTCREPSQKLINEFSVTNRRLGSLSVLGYDRHILSSKFTCKGCPLTKSVPHLYRPLTSREGRLTFSYKSPLVYDIDIFTSTCMTFSSPILIKMSLLLYNLQQIVKNYNLERGCGTHYVSVVTTQSKFLQIHVPFRIKWTI